MKHFVPVKAPHFQYALIRIYSASNKPLNMELLSLRSHITKAITQLYGNIYSGIKVEILSAYDEDRFLLRVSYSESEKLLACLTCYQGEEGGNGFCIDILSTSPYSTLVSNFL